MEERTVQRSPSKESCNSLELDDFIKKIILGAQESLQNSSQSSFIGSSTNNEALRNVSSIIVSLKSQTSPVPDSYKVDNSVMTCVAPVMGKELSEQNLDYSNEESAALKSETAVSLTIAEHKDEDLSKIPERWSGSKTCKKLCLQANGAAPQEEKTDENTEEVPKSASSHDSSDLTDTTPVTALVLDSCKVDNSVVTCVTSVLGKELSEQNLGSSNEESTALKSETAVSFTIAKHKDDVSIEDLSEIPERSSGCKIRKKLRTKFMKRFQSNKVAPQEEETLKETSSEKRSAKIAIQASTTDWDEVIMRNEDQDCEGRDIFLLNLQNEPEKKALSSHILTYINNNLTSERFVILVKTDNLADNIKTRYALAKELYQMLKNSFSEKLSSCVMWRPNAKLKTAFYLTRPFIQRKMRNKISIAKTTKKVVECHGIPDTILRHF